jgi:myosin heavy subunit
LRCAGLVEAIHIARSAFPHRMLCAAFVARFQVGI